MTRPPLPALRRGRRGAAPALAALLTALVVGPGLQRGPGPGGPTLVAAAPRKAPEKAPASQRLPTVDELCAKVERARTGLETLVGDFAQRKRLSLFRDEVRSTGRLKFRRPGQLRWEYLTPDPSVIILDGARVTVKTPGAKADSYDLSRQPGMKALLERLLAALGATPLAAAAKDFELKVTGPAALRLTPRGELAKHLVEVELRFDAAWQVAGVRLREKNGDHTEITFAALKRNTRVDDGAFKP